MKLISDSVTFSFHRCLLKFTKYYDSRDVLFVIYFSHGYDYKKVFSEFDTTRNTWPNNKLWIIVLANILKIILGQKFKLNFYKNNPSLSRKIAENGKKRYFELFNNIVVTKYMIEKIYNIKLSDKKKWMNL